MKKLLFISLIALSTKAKSQSFFTPTYYDSTRQEQYINLNPVFWAQGNLRPVTRLGIQYPQTISVTYRDSLGYSIHTSTVNIMDLISRLGTVQDSIFMQILASDTTFNGVQIFTPNGK
jgi:hypothetical protein